MTLVLDNKLVKKAVEALLDFEQKKASSKERESLLGEFAKPVIVQVGLL